MKGSVGAGGIACGAAFISTTPSAALAGGISCQRRLAPDPARASILLPSASDADAAGQLLGTMGRNMLPLAEALVLAMGRRPPFAPSMAGAVALSCWKRTDTGGAARLGRIAAGELPRAALKLHAATRAEVLAGSGY